MIVVFVDLKTWRIWPWTEPVLPTDYVRRFYFGPFVLQVDRGRR